MAGRTRRTAEQQIEMVNAFRASGLASDAFCKQENITTETLKRWITLAEKGSPAHKQRTTAEPENNVVSPAPAVVNRTMHAEQTGRTLKLDYLGTSVSISWDEDATSAFEVTKLAARLLDDL